MEVNYFTILCWFCHTSTWICHGYTRVPHPELPSFLPPHTIPLGCPSAPAASILYPASNLHWWLVSYMILYMIQCHSLKSSYPLPLTQSPKDCSIHLCLFCCLPYRFIVTIFLIPYICVSILYGVFLSGFTLYNRILSYLIPLCYMIPWEARLECKELMKYWNNIIPLFMKKLQI